uniref:DUF1330 domain-containing protein n=1 Tax=OCS116 cluster bacterium TaxID=2030921 RepID=A0A2A4YVW0_9PROT
MKNKSITRRFANLFIAAFMAVTGVLSANTALAHDSSPALQKGAYFVDILYLQDGKTPADAKAYFDKVTKVIAGHGLERITPAFIVTNKMSGDIEPQLVNVWSVSDPENTFKNIFSDEGYLKHVPLRNATFDMQRSHMFMLKAAQ